jgi:hypothetical protein
MLIFQVIFWSKPLLPNYQAMKNKATSYFLMSTQGQFADGGSFGNFLHFMGFCMITFQKP